SSSWYASSAALSSCSSDLNASRSRACSARFFASASGACAGWAGWTDWIDGAGRNAAWADGVSTHAARPGNGGERGGFFVVSGLLAIGEREGGITRARAP